MGRANTLGIETAGLVQTAGHESRSSGAGEQKQWVGQGELRWKGEQRWQGETA